LIPPPLVGRIKMKVKVGQMVARSITAVSHCGAALCKIACGIR
jgi:hypothetical protein